jgi:hypothetical protein
MELFSPRKRAREGQRNSDGSMEIQPAPTDYNVFRTLREKTSSIWSPHLRQDRRHSRFNAWDPPATSWSADSGVTGKRNIQIVLFAVGFIMPVGKLPRNGDGPVFSPFSNHVMCFSLDGCCLPPIAP